MFAGQQGTEAITAVQSGIPLHWWLFSLLFSCFSRPCCGDVSDFPLRAVERLYKLVNVTDSSALVDYLMVEARQLARSLLARAAELSSEATALLRARLFAGSDPLNPLEGWC